MALFSLVLTLLLVLTFWLAIPTASRAVNLTHCTSYGLLSVSLLLQRPDRLPFCSI